MKSITLSFALKFALPSIVISAFASPSLANPKSYEPVELCRPRTNNVIRTTAQYLVYPTTPVCTRPYIRVHNSLSRPRSLPEFIGNVLSPYTRIRFEDDNGNKASVCPTATYPNRICF